MVADDVIVDVGNPDDIVAARQAGHQLARKLGFSLTDVTMIATATSADPPTPLPTAVQMVRPLALTQATEALKANTIAQQVTTDSIDISFEHCIVTMGRPWFPDTLLMLRNWYVPGYARGEISNATGARDPGLMPVLTTGFVAIRNIKIASQWSEQDLAAVQGSASFGPFSLIGRSYDAASGTLTCPGMQIIGWDPAAKVIRSWTFDSDGGFAEATWENKKDRWYIRNHGILADGRKATMTNVIKKIDDNSFSWQTIERTAGGEILPNIDEVVIVREQ